MRTVQVATQQDLGDVLMLLNHAARWLSTRGIDQWSRGFGPDRIGPMVDRAEVYIIREGPAAIATVAASRDGDTDFWTPAELAQPALYISKLAIARDQAGAGLGALTLRWIVDQAAQHGIRWVRLDAWRTNRHLHTYYRQADWTYVRTVERSWRRSGALFQRQAAEDLEARAAFRQEISC
jgi:GNAT superfamily N-acetyltransferase